MEFRKMLMITLYAEQKKRHRFIEQSFRLCGRRREWDVSREQHRNMYTIKGETDYRPRLDAWDKRSDLVLWEDLEGGGRGDWDGEDMWTQGLFLSMYDKIHYKLKKEKKRKTSTSFSLTMLNLWLFGSQLWKILKDGNIRLYYLSPEKPVCMSRSNS